MAKYLRPRRGTKANAVAQQILLKKGEFFLEYPNSEIGKGPGRIIVGDGATQYQNLDYNTTATNVFRPFITDPEIFTPRFENTTPQASSFTYDWNATTAAIDSIGNGSTTSQVTLPTIIGAVKKTLCLNTNAIAKLNNDLEEAQKTVAQSTTSAIGNYDLLFGDSDDSTKIKNVYKSNKLIFNNSINQIVLSGKNTSLDTEIILFAANGRTSGGNTYASISKTNNASTTRNYLYSDDIKLSGTNNTWDGTNSSLKSAIGSLKGTLDDKSTWVELLTTSNSITTTATSYNLNDDFTKYKSIVIQMCRYDNVYQSIMVSSTYFNSTSSGVRPILGMWNENTYAIQVYKNTTTKAYIKAGSNLGSDIIVKIYGIK